MIVQIVLERKSARRPVSRVLSAPKGWAAIPLGNALLRRSSNQPGRRRRAAPYAIPIRSCSRWGLPCRPRCRARGALLPHPFALAAPKPGGLLSVALSLGSLQPGVTRHRCSAEPGLSSPARAAAAARPSGKHPITVWAELVEALSFFPSLIVRPERTAFDRLGATGDQSSPVGLGKSSASRIARHSPSTVPSINSGRKRR